MIKELKYIEEDLHEIRGRIAQYKQDAQRACNIRALYDDPEDFIESLLDALVDAAAAYDALADDLLMAEVYVDKVIADAEYNEVVAAATS